MNWHAAKPAHKMRMDMIQLTDYLYSGDTVIRILHKYTRDLLLSAGNDPDSIDRTHAEFLQHMCAMLEHNDFLTSQSQRIRDFYKYMTQRYPYLSFTFHGRIKSLIRAEEKFNGYIISGVSNYYAKHGTYPSARELRDQVGRFRDLIAYRIVISMPACHLNPGDDREKIEIARLYEIANELPDFLEARGFTPEDANIRQETASPLLHENIRQYYKDYIANPKSSGYRSLHIVFYDNPAHSFTELQLRTKDMDDFAEIGDANHSIYELNQQNERSHPFSVPEGECIWFDEAYRRVQSLQNLDLSKVDVNMFRAMDNYRINDGCGLYASRFILPYEHLSRFQNDRID